MKESKKLIPFFVSGNTPVYVSAEWYQMASQLSEEKRAKFILTTLGVALRAKGFESFNGFQDKEMQTLWEKTKLRPANDAEKKEGLLSVTKKPKREGTK